MGKKQGNPLHHPGKPWAQAVSGKQDATSAVARAGLNYGPPVAARLTTFFPKIVIAFAPGYVFLFFCVMIVLQFIQVKLMVPETKDVPLEDVQKHPGISA